MDAVFSWRIGCHFVTAVSRDQDAAGVYDLVVHRES